MHLKHDDSESQRRIPIASHVHTYMTREGKSVCVDKIPYTYDASRVCEVYMMPSQPIKNTRLPLQTILLALIGGLPTK